MSIRMMTPADISDVLEMMRVFYASEAVSTDGSEEIFRADVEQCLSQSPYLEGYILEQEGVLAGYGMLAKSFSTEFGKPCIWVEDLYLKPEYREQHLGSAFLQFVRNKYPEAVCRLEVEPENARAVHTYEKNGYGTLPYTEMIQFPE